ncbi:MAG: glycosyl hydrolase 115 family protein [Thermoguttaceae bacterium]|jgi:hypothetical protein|nr:glycosyl hydrolase 115 family protein [Thermoguttaceae bacterium]
MRNHLIVCALFFQLAAVAVLPTARAVAAAPFALSTPEMTAAILVPPEEAECVVLAAEDLAADVERITGRRPAVVRDAAQAGDACVLLATVDKPAPAALVESLVPGLAGQLKGKWEAFRVLSVAKKVGSAEKVLLIAGSDPRGTMFGLYTFCEEFLQVDPLYFWASYPPKPRDRLEWESVDLVGDEPAVRYRGWFINDEDLLTEWYTDGGDRDIDYPYYAMVTSPKASRHVFEAALRLRMNLIIPASFVNITNPAEERLVADAVRRGLLVSQHHIEPLGVSGFGFLNYWRDRGETVPYSYTAHPEKFDEVWREFAGRWAKYGDAVVWQLGLRGIADRPLWASDKNAPESMEDRGALISRAMTRQYEIVRSVDRRPNPPATTTLWMEGAALHEAGHLTFPKGITIVFADNGPGWKMDTDFFSVERRPDHTYGIYHHQALWSHGPHMVQGVSPARIGAIVKEAHRRQSDHYVITNVSNVREFIPGLAALSESLRAPDAFDADEFFACWCRGRFGAEAEPVERCYRDFFACYEIEGVDHRVPPLDATSYLLGVRVLNTISPRIGPDYRLGDPQQVRDRLRSVRIQAEALDKVGRQIDATADRLDGDARRLFVVNLMVQQRILLGLLRWTEGVLEGVLAFERRDWEGGAKLLRQANAQMDRIQEAQALASFGVWEHWYRGDRKMNLARGRELAESVAAKAEAQR